jgi:Serine/Threonine/Tyrosine Kinase found in polyvalent proteins
LEHHSAIESLLSISAALQLTRDDSVHAGAAGFLRRAAQSLADAGRGDTPEGPGESIDDEVCVLSDLITRNRRWLSADEVGRELQNDALKGGKEHRVALLPGQNLVLKVADARMLATESLFDYLSDLLLSNLFFDDAIQLLGGMMEGERLQIIIAQPYIDGVHPEWKELKAGLIRQNLRDPAPRAHGGNFLLDHHLLGEVDVFDLHPNNVIQDATGWLHPIDAHFYFADRATRIAALKTLGLFEK